MYDKLSNAPSHLPLLPIHTCPFTANPLRTILFLDLHDDRDITIPTLDVDMYIHPIMISERDYGD
jgi:hypothetical protein